MMHKLSVYTETNKDRNKDCTKRNIRYEIKCLTCEEELKEKIIESEED